MQNLTRKILVTVLLVIISAVIIVTFGVKGLWKKAGIPGLDSFFSDILERHRADNATGPFPETTLPSDIKRIIGTWSGLSDVDGKEWQFIFEDNYAVRISNSTGYFHQGTAFIHWNLGLTDGNIRVPPGWSILDVDITQSSEPSYSAKISLGAFAMRKDILKYCFSEPGKMVRPITDDSREGLKCFDLTKSVPGTIKHNIPQPDAPTVERILQASEFVVDSSSSSAPASSASGEAEIILDSTKEVFQLRTDPDSETDFSDPWRLKLHFQAFGAKFPSARRIEIVVNSMRTGVHIADGLAYTDNLFIKDKVPVGSNMGGRPSAVFLYIADGGRIFPPRSSCSINITSAYSGSENEVLEGTLSACVVHSAGETHTISSLKFFVRKGKT